MRSSMPILSFVLIALAPIAAMADHPADAVNATKQYLATYQKDPAAAIEAQWDFNLLASHVFQHELKDLPADERGQVAPKLKELCTRALANPRTAARYADAEFAGYEPTVRSDKSVLVNFAMRRGRRISPQIIIWKRVGNNWRVMDFGGPRQMLIAHIDAGYRKLRHEHNPLEYLELMLKSAPKLEKKQEKE